MRRSDWFATGAIALGTVGAGLVTQAVLGSLATPSAATTQMVVESFEPTFHVEAEAYPIRHAPLPETPSGGTVTMFVRSADPVLETDFEMELEAYADGQITSGRTPFSLVTPREHLNGLIRSLEGGPDVTVEVKLGTPGWPKWPPVLPPMGTSASGSFVWVAHSDDGRLSIGTAVDPGR